MQQQQQIQQQQLQIEIDNSNQLILGIMKNNYLTEYIQSFKSDLDGIALFQPIRHNTCIFDQSQLPYNNYCPVCKQQNASFYFDTLLFTILTSSPGNMNVLYQKQNNNDQIIIRYTLRPPTNLQSNNVSSLLTNIQVKYSLDQKIVEQQVQFEKNNGLFQIHYNLKYFLNDSINKNDPITLAPVILLLNNEMRYDTLAFYIIQKKMLYRRVINPTLSCNARIQIDRKMDNLQINIYDEKKLYVITHEQLQNNGITNLIQQQNYGEQLKELDNPNFLLDKGEVIFLDHKLFHRNQINSRIQVLRSNYTPILMNGTLYLYGGYDLDGDILNNQEKIVLSSQQNNSVIEGPQCIYVKDLCFQLTIKNQLIYCSSQELIEKNENIEIIIYDTYRNFFELKYYKIKKDNNLTMRIVANCQCLFFATNKKTNDKQYIPGMLFQIDDQGVGMITIDDYQKIIHISRII